VEHEVYLSHVMIPITASRNDIYSVLVYCTSQHPMMLTTNKEIHPKEDVIAIAKLYFSQWNISAIKSRCFSLNPKTRCNQCVKLLYDFMHGISAHLFIKTETNALKVSLLVSQMHLRHTFVCERRYQDLIQDET